MDKKDWRDCHDRYISSKKGKYTWSDEWNNLHSCIFELRNIYGGAQECGIAINTGFDFVNDLEGIMRSVCAVVTAAEFKNQMKDSTEKYIDAMHPNVFWRCVDKAIEIYRTEGSFGSSTAGLYYEAGMEVLKEFREKEKNGERWWEIYE